MFAYTIEWDGATATWHGSYGGYTTRRAAQLAAQRHLRRVRVKFGNDLYHRTFTHAATGNELGYCLAIPFN